jgi:hypothetical protein
MTDGSKKNQKAVKSLLRGQIKHKNESKASEKLYFCARKGYKGIVKGSFLLLFYSLKRNLL